MTSALIIRYTKFLLSTLGGTLVDTVVLWIMAHRVFDGWYVGENIISPAISFECAVFTNYVLAYFFVWNDRMGQFQKKNFCLRFVGYNMTCIAGFLIKMVGLLTIQWITKWDVVICNLLALICSGIFNFVVNEWVVFKKKTTKFPMGEDIVS